MGSNVQVLLDRIDGIADIVREHAAESERRGRLVPAVVDALHDADVFRALVPSEFGGYQLTLPESLRVFERMAELDASTAWTYAILANSALLARFLGPDACERVCRDPRGLAAGTLNPATARAVKTDGGLVFSGRATYLSGSLHAKYVMASAFVTDGDEMVFVDGFPDIRAGVFPIDRARSLDTWHVSGMRATGSSDYEFENVEVADDWTFAPFRARAHTVVDPFDRIPLWGQLGGALASVVVGTARNMVDRFAELAATKVPVGNMVRLADRASAQIAFGEAFGRYQAAHAVLHDTATAAWARACAGEPFDNDVLARHRSGFVAAVRLAAECVDLLHDAAGMTAVMSDSVFDRCWRDVHTMTQHITLSPARYEIVGRVLLGLDPGAPVI